MPFIELVDDEEFAAADREALGYTPNYNRLFARRPDVYAAWRDLNVAIRRGMDRRRYEIAAVAAAEVLRSSYCALAHGQVLLEKFGVRPGDALDDEERAVQELARRVAEDATSISTYGAAEVQTERMGFKRYLADDRFLAPLILEARAALSDPAFGVAEAAGRALSYENAIAEAREWLEHLAQSRAAV